MSPPAAPVVRTITLQQPLRWLVLGWRDVARCGWVSFAHGLVLTIIGLGLLVLGLAFGMVGFAAKPVIQWVLEK